MFVGFVLVLLVYGRSVWRENAVGVEWWRERNHRKRRMSLYAVAGEDLCT